MSLKLIQHAVVWGTPLYSLSPTPFNMERQRNRDFCSPVWIIILVKYLCWKLLFPIGFHVSFLSKRLAFLFSLV